MSDDDLTEIEKRCLNGVCEDNNYEMVINSIREALEAIQKSEDPRPPKDFDSKDGAIVFYSAEKRPNEKISGLKINVFPLCDERAKEKLPTDLKFREEVVQIINDERPYNDLYHIDLFQENSNTINHHFLEISDSEILIKNKTGENDLEGLNFFKSDTSFFRSWDQIIEDIESSKKRESQEESECKIQTNTLDFIYFDHTKVKDKGLLLLPIPAVSVPVILIVIPKPYQVDGKNTEFGTRVRMLLQSTVYNYLGDRIIRKLTNEKELKSAIDSISFVAKFLEEISEVLLPNRCSYTFDDSTFQTVVFETNDWIKESVNPMPDKARQSFTINLNCFNYSNQSFELYKATFELVDYVFKEHPTEPRFLYNSDKALFENELKMLKIRLENLFRLVYDKWESIRFQNERIDSAYFLKIQKFKNKYFEDNSIITLLNDFKGEVESMKEELDIKPSQLLRGVDYKKFELSHDQTSFTIKMDDITISYRILKLPVEILFTVLRSYKTEGKTEVKKILQDFDLFDFDSDNGFYEERDLETSVQKIEKDLLSQAKQKKYRTGEDKINQFFIPLFKAANQLQRDNFTRNRVWSRYYDSLIKTLDNVELEYQEVQDISKDFEDFKESVLKKVKQEDKELKTIDREKYNNKVEGLKKGIKYYFDKISQAFKKEDPLSWQGEFFDISSDNPHKPLDTSIPQYIILKFPKDKGIDW